MDTKRTVLILFFVALMTGCQTIYPVVPRWDANTIDRAATQDPFAASDKAQALVKVQGMRNLLASAADRRRNTEIAASEVAYYGTLIGVLGLSLDKQGLINSGSGALSLGTLFTGRYRLAEQASVFRKAEARVVCIEQALLATQGQSISGFSTQNMFDSAVASGAATGADKAGALLLQASAVNMEIEIPYATSDALRKVVNDLRISLAGLMPTPMTKEQMKKVLDDALGEKEQATDAMLKFMGKSTTSQNKEFAQIVATLTYKEQVAACFVQYPQ